MEDTGLLRAVWAWLSYLRRFLGGKAGTECAPLAILSFVCPTQASPQRRCRPWQIQWWQTAEHSLETPVLHLLLWTESGLPGQLWAMTAVHFTENQTSVCMRCCWRAWPRTVVLKARHGPTCSFIGGNCSHSVKLFATRDQVSHYLWTLPETPCPSRTIGVTRSSRVRFQVLFNSYLWGVNVSALGRALTCKCLMQKSKMELLIIP